MTDIYGAEHFAADLGVSRETMDRLSAYAALLEKWQAKINLVGPATLPDLWRRHMLDSAQLISLAPAPVPGRKPVWLDFGSGAGFPGLVLAILGAGEVHLVESDQRKCAFLREAARITEAGVVLHPLRIENLGEITADVITARALAPLDKLLDFAAPHRTAETIHIFPKGKDAEAELTQARRRYKIEASGYHSRTDPQATILAIRVIDHA